MRGAHSDVWCSKGHRLIEAELFAAFCRRPAPNGRALLCAADNAREIQGITASQNLPDARNRVPVTPVSLHISDVSAQRKVRGVKRGQETIWCPVPFCPPPWVRRLRRETPAIPPPWVRRLRRQTAALPAAEGGNSSPVNTGVPAAFGGNFYDGRQFPSLTQVVS